MNGCHILLAAALLALPWSVNAGQSPASEPSGASPAPAVASSSAPFFVVVPDPGRLEVRLYRVGAGDEEISLASRLSLSWTPSGVTADPQGRVIVTGRSTAGARAATLQITAAGMVLQHESDLPAGTGYTSVDRTGRFLMAAHYKDGRADVYRLQTDGSIGPRTASIVLPSQAAHSILTTADNRFAYVPCVKEHNALYQLKFDATRGQLTPLEPVDARPPALFGPRHPAFHPRLPIVYFSNEQQLGVSVYRVAEDGQLQALQHAATRPRREPYTPGTRGLHASDLVVTADGQRLFVAVRDFVAADDAIYAFRIADDGRLRLAAQQSVGDIPWKVDLSPEGTRLLVSESADRTLAVYRLRPDNGLQLVERVDIKVAARDFLVLPHPPFVKGQVSR